MLKTKKQLTLEGGSYISKLEEGGTEKEIQVSGFRAFIDADKLDTIPRVDRWAVDLATHKENLETVISDQLEFEKYVYKTHEEMVNEATEK